MNHHHRLRLLVSTLVIPVVLAGRWVEMTTDNSDYKKANGLGVPIAGRNIVILKVKVCKGAEIQLIDEDDSGSGSWVYFKLGGDNNEWSAMASSHNCDDNGCYWIDYVYNTPVDCNEFKQFWVSWNNAGSFEVGAGDRVGTDRILGGSIQYVEINYLQVSNYDEGVTAEWKFLIDDPPSFIKPAPNGLSSTSVDEGLPAGEIIYTVSATDPDGDPLTFLVLSPTGVFKFEGNKLQTLQRLDYETTNSHKLSMRVSDGKNFEDGYLTVFVGDVIDESPIIVLSPSPWIPEEMSVGTIVSGIVYVSDADVSDTLTYSIQGNNSDLFSIDPTSGTLTIAKRIDRDQADLASVTFELEVTDSKNLQAIENVTISITDINDNDPKFSESLYTVSVPENTGEGAPLLLLTVTDDDSGENAEYNISIQSGDQSKFKVIGNQLETGPETLDYELLSSQDFKHTLVVVAVNDDGTRTGTTTVTITITPINEGTPTFVNPSVNSSLQFPDVTISEDIPIGFSSPFTATDNDMGVDGDITFSITSALGSTGSDVSSKFTMDAKTGHLKTSDMLDMDISGEEYYDVEIRIADGGTPNKMSHGVLRLWLIGANDNVPSFTSNVYNVEVSDGTNVDSVVGSVSAYDVDGDQLTYSIVGVWNTSFTMNGSDVITKILLDRSTVPLYVITIRVDDGKFQTDGIMTISVVEQAGVKFEIIAAANVSLKEEEIAGTVIPGVFTTVGRSRPVTYSLTGMNAEYFTVEETTGVLRYGNKRIDRDGVDGIDRISDVTVRGVAQDGQVSTADLSFVVEDINDNPPVASDMAPKVEVGESSANNQLVMSFDLTDADKDSNGVVTLSITSGNTDNIFSIVNHDLFVDGSRVDCETMSGDKEYSLVLLAIDNPVAASSMTSAIRVMVKVKCENEFPPTFTFPSLDAEDNFPEVTVEETAPMGYTLETFAATDDDEGDDGRISYSLQDIKDPSGKNVMGKFEMRLDGRLVVSSFLDYDEDTGGVPFYIVTVVASDNSAIAVKNTVGTLKINLKDVKNESVQLSPKTQTSNAGTSSELWVMRALVAVLGIAVFALSGAMLKSILTSSQGSSRASSAVAPEKGLERPVSITPHMSMESLRIPDDTVKHSWSLNRKPLTSLPPLTTKSG